MNDEERMQFERDLFDASQPWQSVPECTGCTAKRADIERLRAKLNARTEDLKFVEEAFDDFKNERLRVLNEECAPDEQHCTCVPSLQHEIERLRAERDARRRSLAQEVRECLRVRGFWAPESAADLIVAVGQALDRALRGEVE